MRAVGQRDGRVSAEEGAQVPLSPSLRWFRDRLILERCTYTYAVYSYISISIELYA